MNFHPIQLNFAAFINNSTLSDIKLKATTLSIQNDDPQRMNVDDSKMNDSSYSLSSLDDDEDRLIEDGIIFCHWDIIRARCIVFDLIFHAMNGTQYKADKLPTKKIYVDTDSNTIHFDYSYQALLIVIKYIYTGITRRYDYDDISIASDVMSLANVLHLNELLIDIKGQFMNSRKRLKDMQHKDTLNEWKAMKLDTFDFNDWSDDNDKYFLNINVLYHYDCSMYSKVSSRQLISISNRIFSLSKIIFISVSQYFKAMFCKSIWKEEDIIEMGGMNANDFDKLQRFIYTFDRRNYYDLDHGDDAVIKKKLLNDTISAFHLSIFFGIDDLRQCLILVIDKYYLCKNTLCPFWNLGFEFELKDVKELCSNYFSKDFGAISSDREMFYSFTKNMIKSGLSNGNIKVNTGYMIQVLVNWANYHETSIQELLPPNTLFNEANKEYVLSNRRPRNIQHLLRLQ